MPGYLLSVHHPEPFELPDGVTTDQMFADVDAFNTQLQQGGNWVFAAGLVPSSSATVVDGTGPGAPVITDGPYLETKEYLGGFWVIKAADLDEALALAGKGSAACQARVEVRPLQDEPE